MVGPRLVIIIFAAWMLAGCQSASPRERAPDAGETQAVPRAQEVPETNGSGLESASDGPSATLAFRAMLRDENRNHVLEQGERMTLEVEITNLGPGSVSDIEIRCSGKGGIAEQFTGSPHVATLPAGVRTRLVATATAPSVDQVQQGELTVELATGDSSVQLPPAKTFVVAIRPGSADQVEVLSVDVDQIPIRSRGAEQPHAVGVAIGIGNYRDQGQAGGRYAVHDAEITAAYWRTVVGVPASRLKLLTGRRALRDDFVDTFETWLPQQVKPGSLVYIYLSGKASVHPSTGAVDLAPYDALPSSTERHYPLRRLHAALARLPIERALLFLEVSLEPSSGDLTQNPALPRWETPDLAIHPGKIVQVIGNHALQEAHDYPLGRHGLFTYHLLKGLAGEADPKKTGRVSLGDLCRYVKEQVKDAARTEFGNQQEPICRPTTADAAIAQVVITRLK
ncbi:MAG: hypothetical protein AB7G48_06285 [Nitrospiraceae bacterium]